MLRKDICLSYVFFIFWLHSIKREALDMPLFSVMIFLQIDHHRWIWKEFHCCIIRVSDAHRN